MIEKKGLYERSPVRNTKKGSDTVEFTIDGLLELDISLPTSPRLLASARQGRCALSRRGG